MDQLCTNVRTRIYKDQIIHIKRRVPSSLGKLNLAVGEEVYPENLLGEGHTFSGFRTIHLASELKVNPREALKSLKRQKGQNIYEGELLAAKRSFLGLREKLILSPADGVIDVYNEKTGDLRIKLFPRTEKIASGVYGIVDHIDHISNTVTIRTQVNIIYGILGSGREREGMLRVLGSCSDLISPKQISQDLEDNIIASGGMIFEDALQKALDCKVAGVISGGMNMEDFRSIAGGKWNFVEKPWTDIGITVMLTEGFGAVPIGNDIFPLLKEHNGKFAILDGNSCKLILPYQNQDAMVHIRKTRLPLQYFDEKAKTEFGGLAPGVKVRILCTPSFGSQGVVESIDKTATKLPSGIVTFLMTVATSSCKIRIPYQNTEIIN